MEHALSDGLLESRMLRKAHVRFGGGLLEKQVMLLAGFLPYKEGLDLVELPTLIETGIEYRINDLRQRDRRSWRLIQDRPVKVVFLYYEDTWQETALQLVAAKPKAALMVEGNLAEGLAAMDVDDGNLMDALMKTVARGRRSRVEWSGMEIAAITKPRPIQQPVLLPNLPQPVETDLEIVQIDLGGGAVQLSWGDLEVMTITKPSRNLPPAKLPEKEAEVKVNKVKVKGGGVQYAFL